MSEWKETILTEVTEKIGDGLHGTPKYDDCGDYFFINGNNLAEGKIVTKQETKRVNKAEFEKYQKPLSEKTILLGINGTIGNLAFYNGEKCVLGKSACYINVNEKVNKYFLYYNFLNRDFQYFLEGIATGTTIPNVPLKGLREYSFKLPPLSEQTAIAEVLSSLDDKIDLLHRQNKTLEQLVETLFRQWFVEGNISTELIELGSLVNTINGVSYKSTELNSSTTAMVSLKSFDRNGGFRIDGFKEFTGKYKEQQTVKEGDLVVAHTDITQDAEVIGNPALVISNPKYTTMVISMDMVKVTPKVDWISIEFLYFLMRTREFKGHCEGNANGSTVLHLSKQAIPTFEFVKPNKEKVIEFTRQSKELLSKTFENHRQIRTLTQLRDTLLPKMMSGEIKIEI